MKDANAEGPTGRGPASTCGAQNRIINIDILLKAAVKTGPANLEPILRGPGKRSHSSLSMRTDEIVAPIGPSARR